jgi:glycogen phosphorylase
MAKSITMREVDERISEVLSRNFSVSIDKADRRQMYMATVISVRDQLLEKRKEFRNLVNEKQGKRVYYLCMEFLLGRSLKNNLYNLGETETYRKVLKKHGFDLEDIYEEESDAGLGNGGLGRLAACFMDSLASGGYPGMGYTLRYEYGLFQQKIVDGWQVELPDNWLPGGEVWLTNRQDRIYEVKFGGKIDEVWTEEGCKIQHTDYDTVEAVAYDMMISGVGNKSVTALRTWKPRQNSEFNMEMFSNGLYMQAVEKSVNADLIGKVLYPADNTPDGKMLRLQQQYFLCSASAQDMVRRHLENYGTLDNFAEKTSIHINDTHPAMVIPELMRIFMDEYGYSWEDAYYIVSNTVSYTNHTVMAEALEVWSEDLIRRLVPRIHQIMVELNRRFCEHIWSKNEGDWEKCERMAILSHGMARMANLSIIGSHTINGVSKMHSEILKNDVFNDFYVDAPDKFTNVTNGIAYRRWLCQANPRLASLLDETIGTEYRKKGDKLINFLEYAEDDTVLDRLAEIKKANKVDFAEYLLKTENIIVDPESIFDVQVKRLHEYKRQLLNALHIASLYIQIKDGTKKDMKPQTFIFGAKAAPGYDMAKKIIRMIVCLGKEIEKDPVASKKLKIVFLENYRVTMAEHIMPAADISEQISLAGKEASGTGNMKLMINGALTIGTLDGANKEMREELGDENIYIFGMKEDEVNALNARGYDPYSFYNNNSVLKRSVDMLNGMVGDYDLSEIYRYLLNGSPSDPYMCLADFDSYAATHEQILTDYDKTRAWNRKALCNIAHASYFTADRAIDEYAKNIWNIKKF